jgi:hypothetical protein
MREAEPTKRHGPTGCAVTDSGVPRLDTNRLKCATIAVSPSYLDGPEQESGR